MKIVILLLLVCLAACNDELPVQNDISKSKADTIHKNSPLSTNISLLSFTPLEAKYNDTITINAKRVGKSKYNVRIKIADSEAKIVSLENQDSLQIIKCLVPHLEKNGFISIEYLGEIAFSSQEFIFQPSLYIFDFIPKLARQNQIVTIFGNDFDTLENPKVLVGNEQAEIVNISKNQIKFRMTLVEKAQYVSLIDNLKMSAISKQKIEYSTNVHYISSASKRYVSENDTITIYGINLKQQHYTQVYLDSKEMQVLKIDMDSIKVIVPEIDFGLKKIRVLINNFYSEGEVFVSKESPPLIFSFNNDLFYGDTLKIYGVNFKSIEDGKLKLYINDISADLISIKDDEITALIGEQLSSGKILIEYENYKVESEYDLKILKNKPIFVDFNPKNVKTKSFELVVTGKNFDESHKYTLLVGNYGFSPKAVYEDKLIFLIEDYVKEGTYSLLIRYSNNKLKYEFKEKLTKSLN